MDSICNELGISKQHYCGTTVVDRYSLICHKQWLQSLEQKHKLTEFPTNPHLDKRSHPIGSLEHPWMKIFVQIYRKQNQKVLPLPKINSCNQHLNDIGGGTGVEENGNAPDFSMPLTYSQAVSYVASTNFKNLWEAAYKKYYASHIKYTKQSSSNCRGAPVSPEACLVPHDIILRELIQRIFNCPIIRCKGDRVRSGVTSEDIFASAQIGECHANVLPAIAGVETSSHFAILFYPQSIQTTLYDCITYSPAILSKSYNKSLFLVYQLFQLSRSIQNMGLFMGDLRLSDIMVRENLWIQVIPRLESNMIQLGFDEMTVVSMSSEATTGNGAVDDEDDDEYSVNTKLDLKFAFNLEQFSLREYCEMWCYGQLSNFDYLTVLNNVSGRSCNNPEYHQIMPWVTDFSARNGMNWRDLKKSKYRLNKGDTHLDMMFNGQSHSNLSSGNGSTQTNNIAHHVSDFLSEITYFVYMARRTPQHILCEHVRPIWVPAEYPASIQRLQEWTPDECIPEFYSDPMVFKSIHEDLPDLELPAWATCPEDFISKHREALESQYVSERLQYWIDLNFGYKLTGKAAVKSKNVCLSMVDNHKNLCHRGVVQLFTHPHPPKRFPSPWFGKIAPRIQSFHNRSSTPKKHPQKQNQQRLAKSSEDLRTNPIAATENDSAQNYLNLTQQKYGSSPKPNRSEQQTPDETINTSSTFYRTTNIIELPKDYNPSALLQSLETMETFFARTFLNQRSSQNPSEKMAGNDMLFEESENSFTNQLFPEACNIPAMNQNKSKQKNSLLVPATATQISRKNLNQLIAEKREKELQTMGCLIVELFLMNRLRPLLMNGLSVPFEERLNACLLVARMYVREIPTSLRYIVQLFFKSTPLPLISEKGLPPPTPLQVLEPIFFNSLIPFPNSYLQVYALIRSLYAFDFDSILLDLYTHIDCNGKQCSQYSDIDRERVLFSRKIAECKVRTCCVQIETLLEPTPYEQFNPIDLLLPHIIDLLKSEETSILAAWYLFDPVATALGSRDTQKYLLDPIMKLYDVESNDQEAKSRRTGEASTNTDNVRFSMSSSFKSRKSVKLYHHSFLLRLIVRFGLKCFLENFIAPLVEAVGGYKEHAYSTELHNHSSNANRRLSTHLKLSCNLDEPESSSPTLITIGERAISLEQPQTKLEMEDVFAFDDDTNSDKISSGENKSIDSLDLKASHAEEAKEDTTSLYTTEIISDIIYGSHKLSSTASAEDLDRMSSPTSFSQNASSNMLPQSPTIAIPNTFHRTYQLNAIDCDIGSKKSADSFDIISETVEHRNLTSLSTSQIDSEATDSLQASVISRMSEAKADQNNRISEMSAESLIWLSHRLGPVLTARYITKNLLRMLSLCYFGQENLLPDSYESEPNDNLNYFSIANAKVVGDRSASRVLECLMAIAALFGEELILLQFFPYIGELISLSQKRITTNLEGALVSALQMLKVIVPCLIDATIMEHIRDIILDSILIPIIRLLSSTRSQMPNGFLSRSVLARKLLDAAYVLCVRIGPDMSKEHICIPVIRTFFLIFDKAYGVTDNFQKYPTGAGAVTPPDFAFDSNGDVLDFQAHIKEIEEIRDVFSPSLAHCSYLAFLRFLGESIMQRTVINIELILTLCHEYEQPDYSSHELGNLANDSDNASLRRNSKEEKLAANSFGTSLVGNRIEVVNTKARQNIGPIEVLDMVAYKFDQIGTTRHLCGNWLAYWRHEISRPEKDGHLNLKQIKLQSFTGHTNSIRSIIALDNENSFMSASKDKTVKLWSLRSEGDGRKISQCQFTYNSHKKSIHSLAFLDVMRFVVSCDSGVHIWDPFIGRPLGILDSPKHNPITVVKCFPAPSPLVIAGTAEASVKIIDSRIMQYVNEWRLNLNVNSNSTVRCLCTSPSGNWLAAGLSSGHIVILDARTGILLNSWRPMECDLLQLAAPTDQLIISSALDHSISVWNVIDGKLQYHMKPPPEPAHCMQTIGNQLIFGTTGNRIGIHSDTGSPHAACTVTKLRSETLRGVLTSFAVLPLNHTFLAGNESGNIVLLC